MRTRIDWTAEDRRELWKLRRGGAGLSDIGRVFGRRPGTTHSALIKTGGFTPVERKPRPDALTLEEP